MGLWTYFSTTWKKKPARWFWNINPSVGSWTLCLGSVLVVVPEVHYIIQKYIPEAQKLVSGLLLGPRIVYDGTMTFICWGVNVCPSVFKKNSLAELVFFFKFERIKFTFLYFLIVSTLCNRNSLAALVHFFKIAFFLPFLNFPISLTVCRRNSLAGLVYFF